MRSNKESTYRRTRYYLLTSILLIFLSQFIAIGYSNSSPIFDGMYINYVHSDSFHIGETQDAQIKFTKVSNEVYHIVWTLSEGTLGTSGEGGSWDENLNTRVVSNLDLPGPLPGSHTWTRILTNVSLNDIIPIFVYSGGDQNFNITAKLNWTLPSSAQTVKVWELKDSIGSILWYEKTTGILLNGTFHYGGFWKKAEFVNTNAFGGPKSMPGFEFIVGVTILSVSIMCTIVLTRYKRKEE